MSDLTTPYEPNLAGLSKMVLAGEDPAELAEIIRALVADLRPQSYLEYRQVELIAQTDFEINRNRRRVPEVERKMFEELYDRDFTGRAHLAAVRGEDFVPDNLSAAAYLRGEETFMYLATQIWRLERARVAHIDQYEKLIRARGGRDPEEAEVLPE
jgi:hypothetical protein